MAIEIRFHPEEEVQPGQSKWWGDPDLPVEMDYPCDQEGNPLTFLCQICLEEIAPYDPQHLLPHEGMLYLFAAVAEYLPELDLEQGDHNGLGEWGSDAYAIRYAPAGCELRCCRLCYEDGEPATLPAEKITFSEAEEGAPGFKLLGRPYYEEVQELYPDHLSLLQVDEEMRWGLTLYDCGMLSLLLRPEELRERAWDEALLYFHSF